MTKLRPVWAILTFVLVLALALTLPPVRAWASDFLGLFRVEKVQVITFNPSTVKENNEELAGQLDMFERFMENNVEITGGGEPVQVASVDEATAQAGFSPRLPAGQSVEPMLFVKPGLTADFTIDQPTLQALMDAADVDVQLPESVNGETVHLSVENAVLAAYGDCPTENLPDAIEGGVYGCTLLMQLPSPSIEAPDDLNVQALGAAMFQFLGLPEAEANRLASTIDWTSTLVLPIPQDDDFTYQEVSVDGVTGTLLRALEENDDRYILLWVKDSRLYFLAGDGGAGTAFDLAEALP